MTSRIRQFRSFLRRRGSILIMVVALLVMVALIATAMISTTSADRFGSQQHQQNVQIDLLVEGAKEIAASVIAGDVYANVGGVSVYRPGFSDARLNNGALPVINFRNFDGLWLARPAAGDPAGVDTWLAPRVPTTRDPQNPSDDNGSATPVNPGIWGAITGPLSKTAYFSSPYKFGTAPVRIAHDFGGGNVFSPRTSIYQDPGGTMRATYFMPTASPGPGAPLINGVRYPGFQMQLSGGGPGYYFLAADADGDGMADSFMQEVPIGEVNGVTYYYSFRIIDNNSAINVNTAFSSWRDFANNASGKGFPIVNFAMFPTNIGLIEHLGVPFNPGISFGPGRPLTHNSYGNSNFLAADIIRLLKYRMTGQEINPPSNVPAVWTPDGVADYNDPYRYPIDEQTTTPRTDFQYFTLAEAMWMGLGRRLDNTPSSVLGAFTFTKLDSGIATSLAYPFAVRDANAPSEPSTLIEKLLPNATMLDYPGNKLLPYSAFDRAKWFQGNFDYLNERIADVSDTNSDERARPLRSVLTSYNPTSNLLSRPLNDAGALVQPAIQIRSFNTDSGTFDAVVATGAGSLSLGGVTAKIPLNSAVYFPDGITVDYNATFGRLFMGFWAVMQENWTGVTDQGSPFTFEIANDTRAGEDRHDPYYGMKWEHPIAGADPLFAIGAAEASQIHPAKMFRSSIRGIPPVLATTMANADPYVATSSGWDGSTDRLPADQMVILRSAIAAANARELRDNDHAITPVDVEVKVQRSGTLVDARARVFGVERQPFITEIYVQTDPVEPGPLPGQENPTGYIAIELYNPYDHDINLENCQLLGIARFEPNQIMRAGAAITLNEALSNLTNPSSLAPTVIPAKGYLILENYTEDTAADDFGNAAKHRPAALFPGLPPTGRVLDPDQGAPDPDADQNDPDVRRAIVNVAYLPRLPEVVHSREMVLMRPVGASVDLTTGLVSYIWPAGSPPLDPLDWRNMAPLDSFDFTGLHLPPTQNGQRPQAWHYARANRATNANDSKGWHFVYPGRYDAGATIVTVSGELPRPRHQGVQRASSPSGVFGWDPAAPETDPWAGGFNPPMGFADITLGQSGSVLNSENPFASYENTFPIQLSGVDRPGPYAPSIAGATIYYPFGGYARTGDVLEVPFIGAYLIQTLDQYNSGDLLNLVELNAVTMDAAMAEDTDASDDPRRNPATDTYAAIDNGTQSREQIGRFCPLINTDTAGNPALSTAQVNMADFNTIAYGDYPPPFIAMGAAERSKLRYHWARDILEYFNALSPHEDYLPNIDPHAYRDINTGALLAPVAKVSNSGQLANTADETVEPTHGLININTASMKVLSAVPWFPMPPPPNASTAKINLLTFTAPGGGSLEYTVTPGADGAEDNAQLAQAIVLWRDGDPSNGIPGNGPFHSLFDLYRVPAFRQAQQALMVVQGEPGSEYGDLSPFLPGSPPNLGSRDLVRFDSDEQYSLLTRVSNLLTTRSDAFTVYILVQGWRNVGTANPELVVQRRAAMIVDRSRCTTTVTEPQRIAIPTP